MKRTRFLAPVLLLLYAQVLSAQSEEIRLWPGAAPGSETWSQTETVTTNGQGDRIISNVSTPTLAVFLPEPERATGTAIVIAPGGALRLLGYDNEGVKVAQWLNSKGIAAFVLKYRTLPGGMDTGPARGLPMPAATAARKELQMYKANANPAPDDAGLAEVLQMAIADAQQALRIVREHAGQWHLDPALVGLMGFSAGGGVAIGTVLTGDSMASPDFLVTLYGPSLMDVEVPPDAPPLFIAVGSTHFNVTKGCLELFSVWRDSGKPVELHVYDQVSAGFGMSRKGLPVDTWPERLYEWLLARGLVK